MYNQKDKEKNHNGPRTSIAMWGVGQQPCSHGNIMSAQTAMSSTAVEELAGELIPKVADMDTDQTIQPDRRMLGPLEWSGLWPQVQVTVCANPQLDLPSDPNLIEMIQKSDLVTTLVTGGRPRLDEELTMVVNSACQEAGNNVRRQFDLAATRAPSRINAKELAEALAQMDRSRSNNGHALARFQKRANQFKNMTRLKEQIKDATFQKLISHLIHRAQSEYWDVVGQWAEERCWECWKRECELLRERFERSMTDSRDYRSKIRLCLEECDKRFNLAKDRLTTRSSGNQVLLEEASKAEFLAALIAERQVGSQSELAAQLRHDFDEKLRRQAELRGMGSQHAQQIPFRALVLALSEADIVDVFTQLLIEGTSNSHSFYEACHSFGPKQLVGELVRRCRITSWFDGRDSSRFGISRCEICMVRMPKANNPKETEIKDLLKALFAAEGFNTVLNSSNARSISVLRIYAGWPIGIEGGNPVLLEAYKKSTNTGHLPHLVGVLPDTEAGEHAVGIMKL